MKIFILFMLALITVLSFVSSMTILIRKCNELEDLIYGIFMFIISGCTTIMIYLMTS